MTIDWLVLLVYLLLSVVEGLSQTLVALVTGRYALAQSLHTHLYQALVLDRA